MRQGPLLEKTAEAGIRCEAVTLEAVKYDTAAGLPMAPIPVRGGTLRVGDGCVELLAVGRRRSIFINQKFPVHSRLAWFISLTGTLSVVFESAGYSSVATFTVEESRPLQAVHDGTKEMSSFGKVVNFSEKWQAAAVGNMSLLAGMDQFPDHHTYTYWSHLSDRNIPDNLKYAGKCIGCGASESSREHCVPKWIADGHGVKPVVSRVLCVRCNSYFGTELEAPIAKSVREGDLGALLHTKLFLLWAVKTALALAAASDVRAWREWMESVREGLIPAKFQVFATTAVQGEPGYSYSVTHFSRSFQKRGAFLLTFAMDGLLFVVLRHQRLIDIPGLPRVLPDPAGAVVSGSIDAVKLHDELIECITGRPIVREP